MKKTLIVMALLMSAQAFAFESSSKKDDDIQPPKQEEEKKKGMSSSDSLYTDVECDMTDYTCYKPIIEMGRQEAIARIMVGGQGEKSATLLEAINVYKKLVPEAKYLSDDQVIELLAAE